MTAIAIIVIGYFMALFILSLLARALRRQLMEDAASLLDSGTLKDYQASIVRDMVRSAYSMREAPMALLGFLKALVIPMESMEAAIRSMDEDSQFWDDPRFVRMIHNQLASAAAASPVVGALAYAARYLMRLRIVLYYKGGKQPSARFDRIATA